MLDRSDCFQDVFNLSMGVVTVQYPRNMDADDIDDVERLFELILRKIRRFETVSSGDCGEPR